MGLYLCVFENDDELDGVEVGSYADFNFFRDLVVEHVEAGQRGAAVPNLTVHSDSDGSWSPNEAEALIKEIELIESIFSTRPAVEFNSEWKKGVAKTFGLAPKNLYDCFFDVDGIPLLERLRGIAEISVQRDVPILFQ